MYKLYLYSIQALAPLDITTNRFNTTNFTESSHKYSYIFFVSSLNGPFNVYLHVLKVMKYSINCSIICDAVISELHTRRYNPKW